MIPATARWVTSSAITTIRPAVMRPSVWPITTALMCGSRACIRATRGAVFSACPAVAAPPFNTSTSRIHACRAFSWKMRLPRMYAAVSWPMATRIVSWSGLTFPPSTCAAVEQAQGRAARCGTALAQRRNLARVRGQGRFRKGVVALLQPCVRDLDAVATASLGFVQRRVGGLQQCGRCRIGIWGRCRDADADGDRNRQRLMHDRLGRHFPADAFRDEIGFGGGGFRHQHEKLLATVAYGFVGRVLQRAADTVGNFARADR